MHQTTRSTGCEADGYHRRVTHDPMILEIEVKLSLRDEKDAQSRLARLPASLVEPRGFERNEIYDTADGALRAAGRLLRLRVTPERSLITFKEKVETDLRAKVRSEVETEVGSPEATRLILTGLGLRTVYRYEKYRSYHAWTDPGSGSVLSISVDETPIGVYVELEGPKPAIDAAARRMGFTEEDYILDDYRTLHLAWLERAGLPQGDLVFG